MYSSFFIEEKKTVIINTSASVVRLSLLSLNQFSTEDGQFVVPRVL